MRDTEEVLMRAKSILRTETAVLAHWYDGLTAALSAERLGCSVRAVEYLRRRLLLTRLRSPTCRMREMVLVVEARP